MSPSGLCWIINKISIIREKLTINNALKVGRREHNAQGLSRGQQVGKYQI